MTKSADLLLKKLGSVLSNIQQFLFNKRGLPAWPYIYTSYTLVIDLSL